MVCYPLYSWHVPHWWTDDGMFQDVLCKKYYNRHLSFAQVMGWKVFLANGYKGFVFP